jgi:uncharacterized protein (TIGR02271 family)
MPLHKIKDFYPDYRDQFGDHDLMGYSLYAGSDKVGSVDDLLVDDEGRFRYLIVSTGAWIFGKKVMLPIGQTRIDYGDRKVYADRLTREQVEQLPEYDANSVADYDYEEQVRGVYRPTTASTAGTGTTGVGTVGTGTTGIGTAPLEAAAPLDATPSMYDRTYDRSSYRYDYDPDLYNLNERDHQTLRLYEERLVANKTRQKTGEVAIGKHVETETQQVSVPVDRERVVIERVTPTDATVTGTVGTGAFQEGEVVRMEVYEETPDIRKETFVREEVQVRKEVEHDTVAAEETIRRERLDIDKDGNPIVRD